MNDKTAFYIAGVVTGVMGVLTFARPLAKLLNTLTDKIERKVV